MSCEVGRIHVENRRGGQWPSDVWTVPSGVEHNVELTMLKIQERS